MKEKLLVLAKSAPIVSKSYEHLICVGGVTENNEWRRVYPVPLQLFWKGYGFKKKSWIEYELRSDKPSNHRQESRKIIPDSVKQLDEEDFANIQKLLQKRLTTLEYLRSKSHRDVSLGVVQPKIIDFYESENKHYTEMINKEKQMTLFGEKAVKIDIPEKEFSYVFKCSDSCPGTHDMLCEDWELAELYRKCENYRKKGKYPDKETVFQKVKQRMLDDMLKKIEIYFVLGTHYRFDTYMIIGVVYPRKDDVF